jgi:2,4-dienoyl-CoA reductase-like NADH-dependent reductase (Old Yellow Enzyme family)
MKKEIFEEVKIGKINVKNRLVRSAAGAGVATKYGAVTDDIIQSYGEISKGGVGLIITELTSAFEDANYPEFNLRADNDSLIDGLSQLSSTIHNNNSKIVLQLGARGTILSEEPKIEALGASAIKDHITGHTSRQMSVNEIQEMVKEFANSALRAKKAGFDGVEVHACHGLLLYKFLCPHYNKRTDDYGGSVENRARVLVEILRAIKEKCGSDFPVWVKLNSADFTEEINGISFEMTKATSKTLAKAGYDLIEISGGLVGNGTSPARPKKEVAYHVPFAREISELIDTDIIVVGGIRNYQIADSIIKSTKVKAVGLTRAISFNPYIINEWEKGNYIESKCIGCNKCFSSEGEKCIFRLKK